MRPAAGVGADRPQREQEPAERRPGHPLDQYPVDDREPHPGSDKRTQAEQEVRIGIGADGEAERQHRHERVQQEVHGRGEPATGARLLPERPTLAPEGP